MSTSIVEHQREFVFRPQSQDSLAVFQVLMGNEYHLPDVLGKDDLIIDVGANIGCFAVDVLRRGAGRVLCYEPEPDNFSLLRRNLSPWDEPFGRAEVYRLAVASQPGRLRFTRTRPGLTSSGHLDENGELDVYAVTLDEVLRLHKRVRLLKLDCEGAEWGALLGCRVELLGRCQQIAAELHCTGHDDPRIGQMLEHLEEVGFDCLAQPARFHHNNWHLFATRREQP